MGKHDIKFLYGYSYEEGTDVSLRKPVYILYFDNMFIGFSNSKFGLYIRMIQHFFKLKYL